MPKYKYDSTAEADKLIVDRLAEIAQKRGVPRAQIALAWLMQKEPVTIPIIGVTKISQLEEAIPSVSIELTPEEIKPIWKNPMYLIELLDITNKGNIKAVYMDSFLL